MIRQLFLLFLLVNGLVVNAQLERRPFLGIQMQNGTEAVAVKSVIPNSTAQSIGLKAGDSLLTINEQRIRNVEGAVEIIRHLKAGDDLQVTVKRKKDIVLLQGKVQEYPMEATPDMVTEYGVLNTPVAALRTIVTSPKDKSKHPAVLFITGVSCYSVDFGLDSSRAELRLLRGLTRNGFVTMRIDRPGTGDSKGKQSCMMDDLHSEAAHYEAALAALKDHPGVDSNRIYLFGHSMGAVIAPMIAARSVVKGIITYGGLGRPFVEYLGDAFRQQAKLNGASGESLDSIVKINQLAANLLLNRIITQDSLRKKLPGAEIVAAVFDIRSPEFFYQLHELNLAAVWKKYKGSVLIMMGEYDYIAHQNDQLHLLETLNNFGNARTELHYVPQTDHGMSQFGSLKDVLNESPGNGFNPAILSHILQWIKQQA